MRKKEGRNKEISRRNRNERTELSPMYQMQAGDLEKVAHILNVPISTFFNEVDSSNSIINGDKSAASIYGNATTITNDDKDKEIEHLKELLAEKERTIQILMSK